jgi:two-component system NtrC family sensor kinase
MTRIPPSGAESGIHVGMNIRTKMVSLLALLFLALIALDIAVQNRVLLPSFAELERDDAKTSMKRIEFTLGLTLDGLQLTAADWGNWDEVYHFMHTQDPAFLSKFVRTNVTQLTMKQLQANALMVVDLQGNVVLSHAQDFTSGAMLDLDLTNQKVLPADFPWRRNFATGEPARGLIQTNLGVMMLAAAPVFDGSGGGQAAGMVIMGRLLKLPQVKLLGAQAQVAVSMVHDSRAVDGEQVVETAEQTQVYRSFTDIYGHPALNLRVEIPRKITARGRDAVTYASAYLIGAAMAALILLVIVLNRMVLGPLARVTRHAVAIGKGTDLSARLNLKRRDEIGLLAQEFDGMVARVAHTSRELVDQSFQAGFAELAKGVLHNLGNAMTPLGVRVTKLGERLRDVPVGDLELAIAELAAAEAGSARQADLKEFLRLGCRGMAVTVGEAKADIEVIQRQSVFVQTALSELMRSTRNSHVVESVCLPDLVTQTLEIVPDACRHRLAVESDESLRKVGVVRIARTVLRLVLQNLIINAADAVRDAGRDKGVLWVAAEIVRDADREHLHLQCKDNGVGIPKEILDRMFEKGFSTKSRETNYGIGLHWCANAIAALGGRIWAASDGPGLGASMHLLLPLAIRET